MKLRELFEAEYGNDIDLSDKDLSSLPDDLPEKISGDFGCSYNNLTSLEHCPSKVGGDFLCYHNMLTSLEHCPSEVGDDFHCAYNKLTSLEHCPSEVGGVFSCNKNNLTSLKDIHKQIKKIGGDFYCHNNPIKSHILGLMLISVGGTILTGLGDDKVVDDILNKWKNQGRRGVLGCQRDLIAAGYKELAQL